MIEIKVSVPDAPRDIPTWSAEKKELGFVPTFYRGERAAFAATLAVNVNGVRLGLYALKINGRTGELILIDRFHPVPAPIEEPAKAPPAAGK